MNIDEYFNEIQEYIKQNIDDKSQIDSIIKYLDDDNIQATVNQDYNNQISIEESAEKILKNIDNQKVENIEPNILSGERGENTMEGMIIKFKDFK